MPTAQQFGQAILEHVQSGTYPESEDVISAELPSSALPEILELIQEARENVKVDIRRASSESAQDVDGWIAQAKQLRSDIQRSQDTAREITEQARQGELIDEQVEDAAGKVELLVGEVAFNESLKEMLERFQALRKTLDFIQRAVLDGRYVETVGLLGGVEKDLASLPVSQNTKVAVILSAKVVDLRNYTREQLIDTWKAQYNVDPFRSSITLRQKSNGNSSVSTQSLIDALVKLQAFDDVTLTLCKDIESLILIPRLQLRADGTVAELDIKGDNISTSGRSSDLSAQKLFSDMNSVLDYLRTQLPISIFDPLVRQLIPFLISKLISIWLASAVPEELDGMEDFEDTLSLTREFCNKLKSYQCPGIEALTNWMKGIPDAWLRKRQEVCLSQVRSMLSRGPGTVERVERVETQIVSKNEHVFASTGGNDDWNAEWSDDETSPTGGKNSGNATAEKDEEDEEDVSAWGLEDPKGNDDAGEGLEQTDTANDEAEAWGWGDENENEAPKQPIQVAKPSLKEPKVNGKAGTSHPAEREVTLKETYNITSLPKEILQIILRIVSEAERLETSEFGESSMPVAAPGLVSLPGLVLAMYRAGASDTYMRYPSGPMFCYNDSLWLAETLPRLPSHQTTFSGKRIQSQNAYSLDLPSHSSVLESFGKRAYAKEMESQRTIITDLLDGAQGFIHCTEHPFNQECDIAVASTVDRLRDLHKQWKDVLSHSALLQSLGSLLSSVANKIIIDIEDMADIPEPESQQLTTYCNRIAALEVLFMPGAPAAHPSEQDPMPLTAVYTPHWLKFQYLANILESSLVDIKYLWTEGELGLEFDTEELVDLVLALFADSPHRRSAVAEIRGRRGVR